MGNKIIDIEVLDLGAPKSRPLVSGKANGLKIGKPLNLVVPEFPRQKTEFDFDPKDYHSFGSDNLFAEGLAAINRQAINSRSILSWKAIYTAGNGFVAEDKNNPILEWVKNANGDNEKFHTVFKKIIEDYNEFGNSYVEFVTDRANTFFYMFHHDATTVRLGRKSRAGLVGIFADWEKVRGRESKIRWIPLLKDKGLERGEDGLLHTFVHIRNYEPQFPIYGLPVYLAGMIAAAIGYKTNRWNISRLDNQFETSGVLEIYGSQSDKSFLENIEKFKKRKVGEGRNSQLLIITRERGGDDSKYTPLIQTNEGDWLNLHKQSDQDMVMSHNWFRSLAGLAESGKLGSDVQQIRTQYELALSTVIPATQNLILGALNPAFEQLGGFDTEGFGVKNVSPVSLADRLDPNLVFTRREGYKILGVEPEEGDENLDQTIKSTTSNEPQPAD